VSVSPSDGGLDSWCVAICPAGLDEERSLVANFSILRGRPPRRRSRKSMPDAAVSTHIECPEAISILGGTDGCGTGSSNLDPDNASACAYATARLRASRP